MFMSFEPADEAFIRSVAKKVIERRMNHSVPQGLTAKGQGWYAALLEEAYRPSSRHAQEVARWSKASSTVQPS